MALKQFLYQPLLPGHIRVLSLANEAPVRMRHVDLNSSSDTPKYVALSYTWGASTETYPFECDGQNLAVRENLLHALSQLKHLTDLPIWIDAMCINQSNEVEKNSQIQMMSSIYRAAERVLIWLGAEIPETKATVGQLRGVTTALRAQKVSSRKVDAMIAPPFVNGIRHLMTSPWWPRLWVLQEATLTHEAVFVCGSQLIPWKLLSSLVKQIKRLDLYKIFRGQDQSPEFCDGFTEILNVEVVQHMHSTTLGTDLIRICRQRICFDPCDRVYGVIGLMDPYVREGFTWESGEKVEDLYPPFVQILLQTDITATILSLTNTTERNSKLPSWCPDLHYRSIASVLADHEGYHAGFNIQTTTKFDWEQFQRDPKILRTKGIIVDAVKTTTQESWSYAKASDLNYEIMQQENIRLLHGYIQIAKAFVKEDDLWRFFIGNILGKEDSKLHWLAGFASIHGSLASRRWKSEALSFRLAFQELAAWSPDAGQPSQDALTYLRKARRVCLGRKLFTTEGGRVGFGPTSLTVGADVCIVKGAKVPFVLVRHEADSESYELVGEAYVHGLMHGEYLKMKKKFNWITLR